MKLKGHLGKTPQEPLAAVVPANFWPFFHFLPAGIALLYNASAHLPEKQKTMARDKNQTVFLHQMSPKFWLHILNKDDYVQKLAQLRFESIKNFLEILEITLLGNQLEFLLFSGSDAQFQAFKPMFTTGQSCLYAIHLTEQHNGVKSLGGY